MLWHKRTTHRFPLVVFGLIALGIVISCTILIVEIYQEQKVVALKQINDTSVIQSNSLQTEYFSAMSKVLNAVNVATDVSEAINLAKDTFLNVRVPADMRNTHLATFLQLVKIEDSKDTFTLDQVKNNISSLLQNILENK